MALEQVFAATPAVGAGGKIIASPFQFLFTGEDKLQLLIVNSAAGVTVQLATRFLQAGAKAPQASAPVFTPTADRTVNTFDIDVGDGYLLNCSAIVVSGSPLVGQTYVMVRILRGASGATLMLGAMLGGYITAKQTLAYPGSPIESSIAGGGYIRQIVGTTPAVRMDIVETVPSGARWELLILRTHLTTSAVAGNRGANLILAASSGAQGYAVSPATIGPSLSVFFGYGQGQPANQDFVNQVYQAPLPIGNRLLAGMQIQTTTTGMQAGDQWAAPQFVVQEWLEAA